MNQFLSICKLYSDSIDLSQRFDALDIATLQQIHGVIDMLDGVINNCKSLTSKLSYYAEDY
jgi:hypothetical protein